MPFNCIFSAFFLYLSQRSGSICSIFCNRLCSEDIQFVPISPLKVAVTLKSKEILKMLKKYGFMDSEEKPELTVKCIKYACQAFQWAQQDEEVNNVLHLNHLRDESSQEIINYHMYFVFPPWLLHVACSLNYFSEIFHPARLIET